MSSKKIEIIVPKGYDFVQDGLDIKFVKKSNSKWEEKDAKVVGYYVNKDSKVVKTCAVPRLEKHGNIFYKESQGIGMIAMAKLTQQLIDFNKGWEPDWFDKGEYKSCIYHEFNSEGDEFKVVRTRNFRNLFSFLAFKTDEDAELFLDTNIKEIRLAKDFI
jgi:hypothetical protein